MTADPSVVLDTARAYIDAGIACIPILPPTLRDQARAGKSPAIKEWQSKRLSPDEFARHFKTGMNLGVVTGKLSGLCVIDIDPRNGGMKWFVEHEHDLGHCVRETTGSGGIHLYYRYPNGEESVPSLSSGGALAPGVELLADGGHQVVTAPSVHRCGKGYYIQNGLTLLDVRAEADELPGWILEIAKGRRAGTFEHNGHGLDGFADTPQNVERVREILTAFPMAVEGQGGDITTFQAACIGRDYGLSPEAFWPVLCEYNRSRCRPPWEEKYLWAKLQNAYRYAKGAKGEKSPEAQFDAPVEETALPDEEAEQQEERISGGRYSLKRPTANAAVFLAGYEGRIKYKDEQGFWYDDEAHVWRQFSDATLKRLIDLDIEAKSPRLYQRLKPGHLREIADRVKTMREDLKFSGEPEQWLTGRRGDFIRLENGILDIRARELLPHAADWFSFTKLPFAYDPEARCPRFEDFLTSVWDHDQDLKECLQLWMGYLLLSDTSAQKFALFIGASRAGKGVLTKVIERIIGPLNCASCTMTGLADTFGLSSLVGKRVAFFHDAYKAQGSLGDLATERLISIVGGDPQPVNVKYRDPFTTTLPVKIVLVCNELPAFVNNRGALSNRMLVFPFAKSFAGREDQTLLDRLCGEIAGVFNWALEGARKLLAGEPLRQPASAGEMFNEIRKALDPVMAFTLDEVEFTDVDPWEEDRIPAVSTETLYRSYTDWCRDNGHSPKSKIKFSMSFKALCPEQVENKTVRVGGQTPKGFTNIKLRRALAEFSDQTH